MPITIPKVLVIDKGSLNHNQFIKYKLITLEKVNIIEAMTIFLYLKL